MSDAEKTHLCDGDTASRTTAKCATLALKQRALPKSEVVALCRNAASLASAECAVAIDRSAARRISSTPPLVVRLCRGSDPAAAATCASAAAKALSGLEPAHWVELCRAHSAASAASVGAVVDCAESAMRIVSFQRATAVDPSAHPVVMLCARAVDAKAPPLCARSASHRLEAPTVARLCAGAHPDAPTAPTGCYAAAPRAWTEEQRAELCAGATTSAPAACADYVDRGRAVVSPSSAALLCRGAVDAARADAPSRCIKVFERDVGVEAFGEAHAVALCAEVNAPSFAPNALLPVDCAAKLHKLGRRGQGGALDAPTIVHLCQRARGKVGSDGTKACVDVLHRRSGSRRDGAFSAHVTRTLCAGATSDAPAQCFFAAPDAESAEVRAALCAGATSNAAAHCAQKARRSGLRAEDAPHGHSGAASLVAHLCAGTASEAPAACYADSPYSVIDAVKVPACGATRDAASAKRIARCLELAARTASDRLDERAPGGGGGRMPTATGTAVIRLCQRAAAMADEATVKAAVECFTTAPRELAPLARAQLCGGNARGEVGEARDCAKELSRLASAPLLRELAPALCAGAPSQQPARCATDSVLRALPAPSRAMLCRGARTDLPVRCMRAVEGVRAMSDDQRVELCRRVADEGELICLVDAFKLRVAHALGSIARIAQLAALCAGATDATPAACASAPVVQKRLDPAQQVALCTGSDARGVVDAEAALDTVLVGFLRAERRDLEVAVPAACFSLVDFLSVPGALALCSGARELTRALCVAAFNNRRHEMWSLADADLMRLCPAVAPGSYAVTAPARCVAVFREGPLMGSRMVPLLADAADAPAGTEAFAQKHVPVPMHAMSGEESATLCSGAESSWPARCALHLLSPSGQKERRAQNASVRATTEGLLLRAMPGDAAVLCRGARSEAPLRCAVAAGAAVGDGMVAAACSGARSAGPGKCIATISPHIDGALRLRLCRFAASSAPALCSNAAPSGLAADDLATLCVGARSDAPALCALDAPSYGVELDQRHVLCSGAVSEAPTGPLLCFAQVRAKLYGFERNAALDLCRGATSSVPVHCAAAALTGRNLRSDSVFARWQRNAEGSAGAVHDAAAEPGASTSRDGFVTALCTGAASAGPGQCAAAVANGNVAVEAKDIIALCRGTAAATPGFCAVAHTKEARRARGASADSDEAPGAYIERCRTMVPIVSALRLLSGGIAKRLPGAAATAPTASSLKPKEAWKSFEVGLLDQYGQPFVPAQKGAGGGGAVGVTQQRGDGGTARTNDACKKAMVHSCYANMSSLICLTDPRVLITLPRAQRKGRMGAKLLGPHVANPTYSLDLLAGGSGVARFGSWGVGGVSETNADTAADADAVDADTEAAAAAQRKVCRDRLQRSLEFGGAIATFDGLALSKPGDFTLRIALFSNVPPLPDDPHAVHSLDVPLSISNEMLHDTDSHVTGGDGAVGGAGRATPGRPADAACWRLLQDSSLACSAAAPLLSSEREGEGEAWYQSSCAPRWSRAGRTAARPSCVELFDSIGVRLSCEQSAATRPNVTATRDANGGPLSSVCLHVGGGIARLRLNLAIPDETMGACESLGLSHRAIDLKDFNASSAETLPPSDCASDVDMRALRKAYRAASLEWHPDRWAAAKSASRLTDAELIQVERVFSLLNAAYRSVADDLRARKRARREAGRAMRAERARRGLE